MRKLLLLIALLAPSLAWGQGSRLDGVVQGLNGPLPSQFVAVCTQPADISTSPCSPLATLYTDTTMTVPSVNPVQADEFGNFHFYAAAGKYTLQSYGPQIQTPFIQTDVILPCDPTDCVLNVVSFSLLIHNSADVADDGEVRLEHPDRICWRNFANTGNLCLSVDGTDAIQFPGGFGGGGGGSITAVTATAPLASSGGTTPDISIASSQGNGTKVQRSTGSTTTNNCVKYDANGNTVDSGAPCGGTSTLLSSQVVCNLGSDISGIGANTLTTIVTCATTAPSSGCPCRAFISWTVAGTGSSSTEQVTGYITDGTNIMLGTSGNVDNQVTFSQKSVSRSGWSTVRYNNSASTTFTLKAESDHTWTANSATDALSLPTQVVVNYLPSN